MFTKATFEMVAHVIREEHERLQRLGIAADLSILEVKFADRFQADNPRFDVKRFHEACQ